jgi:hypothetical protein
MRFQTAALAPFIGAMAILVTTMPASAQGSSHARKARPHFISVDYDWLYVQPYSFDKHPLADLLGQPVSEVHLQSYQYETRDGLTRVTVDDFTKRAQGFGVTIYPFGSSEGPTLAVRGSVEHMPEIRAAFDGPAPAPRYALTNGRATDIAVGVDVADRSPGWGLGSHAFVLGGVGRARTDQMNGTRYFAEGGGGIAAGPIGVDIAFKFVVNKFDAPVTHQIFNLPISVRGTLTF